MLDGIRISYMGLRGDKGVGILKAKKTQDRMPRAIHFFTVIFQIKKVRTI